MEDIEIRINKESVYYSESPDLWDIARDFATEDEKKKEDNEELYMNHEIIDVGEDSRGTDCTPIRIEIIEEMIAKAKKAGATHIEIDYHVDHVSYIVNGVKMTRQTEEEVQKTDEIREAERKETDAARIAELEEELKNLKNKNVD